eukprot:366417-Chlamydomonas_euryale.AAC.5
MHPARACTRKAGHARLAQGIEWKCGLLQWCGQGSGIPALPPAPPVVELPLSHVPGSYGNSYNRSRPHIVSASALAAQPQNRQRLPNGGSCLLRPSAAHTGWPAASRSADRKHGRAQARVTHTRGVHMDNWRQTGSFCGAQRAGRA